VPQIEVSFDIDANGILHVSAKDLGTNKEQSIRITASSGLNEDEIKKMVRDAEEHGQEDHNKKLLAEARNHADTLVYTVDKSLADYADKITPDEKREIEEALENCRKTKDSSSDPAAIKAATDKLTQVSHKLAEHLYKSTGAQGQPGSSDGSAHGAKPAEEEVVEAEFEDVDKDKK